MWAKTSDCLAVNLNTLFSENWMRSSNLVRITKFYSLQPVRCIRALGTTLLYRMLNYKASVAESHRLLQVWDFVGHLQYFDASDLSWACSLCVSSLCFFQLHEPKRWHFIINNHIQTPGDWSNSCIMSLFTNEDNVLYPLWWWSVLHR